MVPFSSYIIFHVANVQIKDIGTEFINPNCIYYCYLYLPIDESSEKAVIILKNSDNVGESIKNIILKNSHGEVIRGIDKIDDVLNLCTMALERVTQQEINCYYQMLFIPYKQSLLSGNYIIAYTNKVRKAMHNNRIIDLAFETIKNDNEPFFSTLEKPSNSNLYMDLFDKIVNPKMLVRRVNISANHVVPESEIQQNQSFEQLDLFTDYEDLQKKREEEKGLKKELAIQEATIELRNRFGKNAILKGINLQDSATTKDRNNQ